MSFSITPIRLPATIAPLEPIGGGKSSTGGFQTALSDAIGMVEQFQQNSQDAIGKFMSGEDEEVHKVALATQQAELSLDLFLQVRNKVVAAYQEVMRMQM
ncbi:MAG TPA: flagellar hook-basal body complex protein FliE [Bryobacteraceae bacterium]|nr:flagellar hook-basal body complex protein FliE [Bryobacteraceae bacterium]